MGLSSGNFRAAQLYVAGDYFVGDFSQANPFDLDADQFGVHLPAGTLDASDYVWVTDAGTGLAKRGLYVPSGFAATLDTDPTMAADANDRVPSQAAVRDYVAAQLPPADTMKLTPYGPFCDSTNQNRLAQVALAGTFGTLGVTIPRAGTLRYVVVTCLQACTGGTMTLTAEYGTSAIGTGATSSGVAAQINSTTATQRAASAQGSVALAALDVITLRQSVASYTGTAGQFQAWAYVEH